MSRETMVQEFHIAAKSNDNLNKVQQIAAQWDMIIEEFGELRAELAVYTEAGELEHPADLLKELCDAQYVLSGMVDRLGWNDIFAAAFLRVHENNMTKVEKGVVKDMNGKVVKPEDYQKVDLGDLV